MGCVSSFRFKSEASHRKNLKTTTKKKKQKGAQIENVRTANTEPISIPRSSAHVNQYRAADTTATCVRTPYAYAYEHKEENTGTDPNYTSYFDADRNGTAPEYCVRTHSEDITTTACHPVPSQQQPQQPVTSSVWPRSVATTRDTVKHQVDANRYVRSVTTPPPPPAAAPAPAAAPEYETTLPYAQPQQQQQQMTDYTTYAPLPPTMCVYYVPVSISYSSPSEYAPVSYVPQETDIQQEQQQTNYETTSCVTMPTAPMFSQRETTIIQEEKDDDLYPPVAPANSYMPAQTSGKQQQTDYYTW